MSLPRLTYEDAAEFLREAAWDVEDRYLWRGQRLLARGADSAQDAIDKAQEALERAQRTVEPLQRLIQTRVTWPMADQFRERGIAARAGIAALAATGAISAGAAGAITAAPEKSSPITSPSQPVAAAGGAPIAQVASPPQTLQGAAPQFEAPQAAPAPPPVAPEPSAPPARVAWQFAQAFVLYEIGKDSPKTTTAFAETADPALAKSLGTSPPRLPTGSKVPEARVLNVVLADRTKKQITASVSLLRLRAVSEIRLTLRDSGDGWRVVQVLG